MKTLINNDKIRNNVIIKTLGNSGRMIGFSKSIYRSDHDTDLIVFNSNICSKEYGKMWYGDINITEDFDKITNIAKKIGIQVYVLREMDARFENEEKPVYDRAVLITDGKTHTINSDHYRITNNKVEYYDKEFEDSEYKEVINFGSMEKFESTKKDEGPLTKIMKFIFKSKKIRLKKDEVFDITLISISRRDEEVLKYIVEKWVRKTNRYLHPVKVQQAASWYLFDCGPSSFYKEEPSFVESGNFYIKKGDLIKKRKVESKEIDCKNCQSINEK